MSKGPLLHPGRRPWHVALSALLVVLGTAAALLGGCAANEPFDPSTVANAKPQIRLFVGPIVPGTVLNPTSYYKRTFRWSGTDSDGWVREYYVSVRTQAGTPAPWITTTRTDTTMTFEPDNTGRAEATFLLACRDDRGALSDTVVQFIPLRNFPPAVNFVSDFDPKRNMQREFRDAAGLITTNPAAAVDTVYWNWGAMNFRLFALDLDGAATMDDFYRYTLADGEPGITREFGDPEADPNVCWVQVPFNSSAEIKKFSIFVANAAPGVRRTLRVSVIDEAGSDAGFSYTWQVRPPAGPVLFIPDGLGNGTATRVFYENLLNARFGVGGWAQYEFWFGSPDSPSVLLETFRKFNVVFWTDTGSGSNNIKVASASNGVLQQYLKPLDARPAGRLLFVSAGLVGSPSGLSNPFLLTVLGVSPTPSPATPLRYPVGQRVLGVASTVPTFTTAKTTTSGGVGLARIATFDNEVLCQFESCTCYGDPRRPAPPFDPVVAVRTPTRVTSALARIVGIGVPLDNFDAAQVAAALSAIFTDELGVVTP